MQPHNLKHYYSFIENNLNINGDIIEVGVYQGDSILETALLLKSLGSDKKVFGFDSFCGFPQFHHNDDFQRFYDLYNEGKISEQHLNLCIERSKIPAHNFENANKEDLVNKINDLNLDNIILIEGDFQETIPNQPDRSYMAALIDCDLYLGYKISLPYCWRNLKGFMYFDEYYSLKYPGARIAVDEFFEDKEEKPFKMESSENEFERWGARKNES